MKPALLGALQLRHLLELMQGLPIIADLAKGYGNLFQQMDPDRNAIIAGAADAKDHPDDVWKAGSVRMSNDTLERLSAILKAVRGRSGFTANGGVMVDIANAMRRYGARLEELGPAQTEPEREGSQPTSYRMEAVKADQGRGTNYWSTKHEMAARAFSAYVEDKLDEQGRSSDFLSYGSEGRFILPIPELPHPFPQGEERKAIDAAFDTFLQTVKTRETEGGNVALFSRDAAKEAPRAPSKGGSAAAEATPAAGRAGAGKSVADDASRDNAQRFRLGELPANASASDVAHLRRVNGKVRELTRQLGPHQPFVHARHSAEMLPEEAYSDPRYQRALGFYDGREAWLVAPNLHTRKDTVKALTTKQWVTTVSTASLPRRWARTLGAR